MNNEMCLISLRDILDETFLYTYVGEIPKKYFTAYEKIIKELGLSIEFKGTLIDEAENVYITHACKIGYDFEMFCYRRSHVRDYIKAHYKSYSILSDNIVTPKYIICSDPRIAVIELIEKETLGDDVVFIYDRTDNWGAINDYSQKLDKMCMKYADIITYSAYGLCPKKYEYKSTYVPNGNKMYKLCNTEKYKTPTAIYVGNNIEKFNGNVFYHLACMYPHWNFIAYVNQKEDDCECMINHPPNVEFRMPIPQEELIKEINKCHVGLLLFYNDIWTSGMLPLKLFNYIDAEIPSFHTTGLETNLQDYSEVAFSIADCTLDELLDVKADYNKYRRSWDDVLNNLMRVWCIPDEA